MADRPAKSVFSRAEFLNTLEVFGDLEAHRWRLYVLLVDITRFGWVNDAYGYDVGDRVLEVVADRIVHDVYPEAVVGRLDGDEFGILVFSQSEQDVAVMARRLLASLRMPVVVGDLRVRVSARVGISPFVRHLRPAVSTLRYANAALTAARDRDCDEPVFCPPELHSSLDARAWVRGNLDKAFESGQLRVAYQPIVSLVRREIVGHEALLRWPRPEGAGISPADFVPVAEEIDLIGEIGGWVLDEALFVASTMSSIAPRNLTMSVNLSPRQLTHPRLVSHVEQALARHGTDPASVAFEITERLMVEEADAARVLEALRGIGCRVGIDDFGTGWSCLSYLRSLPVDFIKVDRSFVSALDEDPRAVRLVATIATMARDLGLTTLAEGIETEGQYDNALMAGCTHGQGYLFGRPNFHPHLTGAL
ncbi:MAG TPA: bifunctional diguanylate cyclase/phosphodiesterase [Acidimicrobiales bacterium]|nr:bifunctional diguanylate cyclase/phosphodiesterase [Acidimicrobiales bacterium]